MANQVVLQMLKSYSFSCLNRDKDGYIKQGVYGDVLRARISSQCFKRAIRLAMGLRKNFRSAHLEDFVEMILLRMLIEEKIKKEDFELYGQAVCQTIGCDWNKRKSISDAQDDENNNENEVEESQSEAEEKASQKAKSKNKGKKKAKGDDDENNGRTVVVISAEEIIATVEAIVNCDLAAEEAKAKAKTEAEADAEAKPKKTKKPIDILANAAEKALDEVFMSAETAVFGTMVTNKSLKTIDSAVEMAHAMSINEFMPENDFISARYSGPDGDKYDPFYGDLMKEFSEKENAKPESETLADKWISANVMYFASAVNLNILKDNLPTSVRKKKLTLARQVFEERAKELVSDYITAFVTTDPAGSQNGVSSHPVPAILYIEYIKDGNAQYTDFEKVIRKTDDKSISEQGIEKIYDFATDNPFRTGEIHKYVMISPTYKDYRKQFEDAGIKVVTSLNELKEITNVEMDRVF